MVNNPTPNPNPNPSPTSGQFNLVGWAEKTDNNGCPVTPVTDFPTGTMSISAIFSYNNLNNGDPIVLRVVAKDNTVRVNNLVLQLEKSPFRTTFAGCRVGRSRSIGRRCRSG